ncbi:MAG: hypothetical protein II016_03815 [Erysipelotrichaceae bacterium]|nr:hypothetical protein [Erysipelotrichaceae bacterium]
MNNKVSKFFTDLVHGLATLLFLVAALYFLFVCFLTVVEYKPEQEEVLELTGETTAKVRLNEEIDLVSWNVSYGGLGDNTDYFREEGKGVKPADPDRVSENVNTMFNWLQEKDADLILLQGVDSLSDRSFRFGEDKTFAKLPGRVSAYAVNHICVYIAYPLPPIGTVQSGIMTLSKYAVDSSTRVSLPLANKWPVRVMTAKHCLQVSRLPVEDSSKELVLVNVQLDTYGKAEAKAAQNEALRSLLEEEAAKGNYVIAGGDFSQTFYGVGDSYPVASGKWDPGILDTSTFSADFSFYMDTDTPSRRSLDQSYVDADKGNFQYYLTDGYIVSSNVEVVSLENADLGFVNSNHNPVCLTVVLK